jgi:hypothetical protein
MMDLTGKDSDLVGRKFCALKGGVPIVMKVVRIQRGWCHCETEDGKDWGRWPVDAIQKEINKLKEIIS